MCRGTASSNGAGESKLRLYIMAPYRALLRARDLYVKSLGGCAGRAQRGPTFMLAMPRAQSRTFQSQGSGGGEGDDFDELIRAASRSRLRSMPIRASPSDVDGVAPRRTQSVATMRIDEERACEFDGVDDVKAVPRSRSDVVSKRKVGFLTSY